MTKRLTGILLLGLFLATASSAGEWTQFRGPDRSGVAQETDLARSWSEDGPRELWRRPLGEGYSAIVVSDGRLYTLYAEGEDELVTSLRADDGSEVWRHRIGRRFVSVWGNGPRATPSIDEETVYALSSYGRLEALGIEDGEPRWAVEIGKELGEPLRSPYPAAEAEGQVTGPFLGYCSSPLLEGDLLIVYTGAGEGRSLVAFDKRSGKPRWTSLSNELTESSPVAVTIRGERQVVVVVPNEIVAVRSTTGEVLWRHPWARATVAVPVFLPPDRIFFSAPNDVGAVLLAVGDASVEEVWRAPRMRNNWQSSLRIGSAIVGFDNATLRALGDDGKPLWGKRGLGRGTVVAADGLLFVLSERGTLTLAEWSPEGFLETGSSQVLTGNSWTSPTIAEGRIFLRNHEEIVALDLRHGPPETDIGSLAYRAPAEVADPLTAEDVIDRCVEALGGEAAWKAVESLDITCHHTSFGSTKPCRIRRKRPNLYRFDYNEISAPRTDVFDGENAWWQTAIPIISRATWPVPVPKPYPRVFRRDAELEMPFLRHREKAARITFSGTSRLEGEPFLELRLERPDGEEERWFLDPETFLPAVRVTQGVYHGYVTEERNNFSDYRTVDGGIVLPFSVETELGNDVRELVLEKVLVNATIDDAVFFRPIPEGMERLRSLAGRWHVRIQSHDDPSFHYERDKPWSVDETTSVIRSLDGASLLQEEIEITTARPRHQRRLYTWDRFRRIYRLASFDTFSNHLDILEGHFDEESRLITTDISTGTPVEIRAQKRFLREVLYDITADSFRLDREFSLDGGESWVPEIRFEYSRIREPEP